MPRKTAIKCYFGCETEGPFHQFPNPLDSERFNKWKSVLCENVVARGDNYIYNSLRLCECHFEHYYRSTSKRLTRNAIPTLNIYPRLPISTSTPIPKDVNTSQNEQHLVSTEMNVDVRVGFTNPITTLTTDVYAKKTSIYEASTSQIHMEIEPNKPRNQLKYKSDNITLKMKLLKLKNKCKTLNEKLKMASKLSKTEAFLKLMEKLPEPAAIFTKMQLSQSGKKPRGRRYTINEKIMCLTIFKQSQKGYNLLEKLFALPTKRSLQKILSCINLSPGINNTIIKHLEKCAKKLPKEKRICSLIFDEVALTPGLYYHKEPQLVVGFEDNGTKRTKKIADHALVLMIKSLMDKYKQPVAFTFCKSGTKSYDLKIIIKEAIEKITSTGLIIVATVCDQSQSNMSAINALIKETNEKYQREGLENRSKIFEINGNKIFPLYDPPHLLKGLRNNLLTKDLKFIEGGITKIAKWQHLEMLFQLDTGEDDVRILNKLTEAHIIKDKIPKMKVSHAAQVFSLRVSATMRFSVRHKILPEECVGTADLLLLVDKLFDSFNSSNYKESKKPFRTALKSNSPHFKLWNDTIPILKSMEFINVKDGIQKFVQVLSIKNFLHNIYVIKDLFNFLKENYKISSLLTRNLNQDPLENFFCNIRSNGVRNTSPTCINFIGAYKTLLVNNLTSRHSVGANCEKDNNKMMRSLKYLINVNKITEKPANIEEEKPLNVDSLVNIFTKDVATGPSNIINTEAKRYVGGYLLKKCFSKMKSSCITCRRQLVSTTPPTNNDYILERDFTGRSCTYPSEELCRFLEDLYIIIQIELKEDPHLGGIKDKIIKKIEICYSGFISCENHKKKMVKNLIDFCIDLIINSWCTNVNRVLRGKITLINLDDEVKIEALNYYKSRNKRK